MKAAIVTWTSYNNYGTLLQAYALQKQLDEFGADNVIIDDSEIIATQKMCTVKRNDLEKEISNESYSRIVALLKEPRRISKVILAHTNSKKFSLPYEESQDKCNEFKRKNLNIRSVKDYDEFDFFIAGSDQIWSVFDGVFNPYYYINFTTKSKISYGPSLGTENISEQRINEIKNLLKEYRAISVREKKTADQLSDILEREVFWVADPTLLHNKEFWSDFAKETKHTKGKYILCYFLENKKWYIDYAKKISKELHAKLILIPNQWQYISSPFVTSQGIGPEEFVGLFKNAEYVLTDSYHGSIFSLLFERPFQYLLRFKEGSRNSQNIRISSLFGYLGIEDRIVDEEMNNIPPIHIDYSGIGEKLQIHREKSLKYLRESIDI